MTNLIVGGVVATAIVVVIGALYAAPPYIKWVESSQRVPSVMLSFSITSDKNMPEWCESVAELLNKNQLNAVVFFPGKIAEKYPDCVRSFHHGVDKGSSTYSFTKLSAERDYLDQLEDVRKGKAVLDSIAHVESKSFKAPYGYTDDNIYSLLSRNNITADFSKDGSYNKYNDKIFIYYDLTTFNLNEFSSEEIGSQVAKKVAGQIQITADNSVPLEKISSLVNDILQKQDAKFVSASDIAETNLTVGAE
jgi:peptidoglycan/xylan/chitin deacetylase (PgdA/CDA1 family)